MVGGGSIESGGAWGQGVVWSGSIHESEGGSMVWCGVGLYNGHVIQLCIEIIQHNICNITNVNGSGL